MSNCHHAPLNGCLPRLSPLLPWLLVPWLLAAGCAATPPVEHPRPGLDDGPGPAVANFRMRGRIGVRGAGQGFSATFHWRQAGDDYEIELWGAFGQGRARVRGDAAQVTITDARGYTVRGSSAEALMAEQLGWSAPVAALRYWVRGRYAPAATVSRRRYDANGALAGFQQLGWAVELSRWRSSPAGPVPGKIAASQADRAIAIICKEWSFD